MNIVVAVAVILGSSHQSKFSSEVFERNIKRFGTLGLKGGDVGGIVGEVLVFVVGVEELNIDVEE